MLQFVWVGPDTSQVNEVILMEALSKLFLWDLFNEMGEFLSPIYYLWYLLSFIKIPLEPSCS